MIEKKKCGIIYIEVEVEMLNVNFLFELIFRVIFYIFKIFYVIEVFL